MAERLITVRRRHRLAAIPAAPTEDFLFLKERRLVIDPELNAELFPDTQPATDESPVAVLNLLDQFAFGAYLMRMLGGPVPFIAALDLLADRRHFLSLSQMEAIVLKTEEGCDTGLRATIGRTGRRAPESGFFVETKRGIQLAVVRFKEDGWRVTRLYPLEKCLEVHVGISLLFVANLRHPF